MKKIVFFIVLFQCVLFHVFAGNVKGQVYDSSTKNVMDFVNVALFAQGSTNVYKSATTDDKGAFILKDIKNGNYTIRLSFVGYGTVEIPVKVSSDQPTMDLKRISLSPDAHMLKQVEVVGQRSNMKFEVDRKVFNVDQNIASAGASASELLQNIPSVDVDTEGNISLRNNSSVVIWINGRPAGLTDDNRAQILEQMPAESIESVEVITNPSAKYSPEGSAGIINLVLKKDRKAGYYGSVSGGGTTLGMYNVSANMNYNSSKLDAYAGVGLRSMRFRNSTLTDRESWGSDINDKTILKQDNKGLMTGLGTFFRAGATYHITAKNDLGLSAMGSIGNRKSNSTMRSKDGSQVLTRERFSHSKSDNNMVEVSLDYQHRFNKGSDLRLYASYDRGDRNSNDDYSQNVFVPQSLSTAQKQTNDNSHTQWEFQADYSNQLSEKFKIEAGYKGNINNRTSNVKTVESMDAGDFLPNPDLDNQFDYSENIQALYATFSGKIDKLSFQAGLRGEYMKYDTKTVALNAPDPFNKEYWHLYPTVFVSYSLPRGNEIQINYTSRVNRPRGRQLSSFRNVTDSTNISYGNPNLKPEFTNSIELNYIKSWEAHTLSASLYYRSTNGVIQQIRYFDDPAMYSTYDNIARSQNSGLELVAKDRLFKILDLTTTFNFYYYQLDGFDYTYRNNGHTGTVHYDGDNSFSWSARMMANFIFPQGFSAQLTGNFNSKRIVAQGERKPNGSLDLGVRKTFLNRMLTVALNGRDLLDTRRRRSTSWSNNFYQESNSKFGGPSVGVTVTYLFGNSKSKQKERPRNNEDSMDGEMMDF